MLSNINKDNLCTLYFCVTSHYNDSDATCVRFSFNVHLIHNTYCQYWVVCVNVARFIFRYLPYMDAFIKINYV